jgi:hypothetical protein
MRSNLRRSKATFFQEIKSFHKICQYFSGDQKLLPCFLGDRKFQKDYLNFQSPEKFVSHKYDQRGLRRSKVENNALGHSEILNYTSSN